MTDRNDGGPAFGTTTEIRTEDDHSAIAPGFPYSPENLPKLTTIKTEGGMSLRDWFAGQALVGLLAGLPDSDCGFNGYAHDAYKLADAMLKARGQ